MKLANYRTGAPARTLVYNEAGKLRTKINVPLRNGTRLMRLVKRYKLGLRELNYADELRMPTPLRPRPRPTCSRTNSSSSYSLAHVSDG